MDMFKVNPNHYQQYQSIGASNSNFSNSAGIIDPRIQKTKDLFQMFHLVR
jgi:hypothetical protein